MILSDLVYNHIARSASETVQRRIDALKIGQKMQDLPEELWHESFKYYVKEDKTRRGGPNLRMIRLNPDEPSLTVTGYIFNKFVHPYENRFITVREAARLQGFPDTLEFKGTLTSTQQQVGNAVPVPLAKAVFSQILKFAKDNSYPSKILHAMSLFSGAGGMDIGADCAKIEDYRIKVDVATDCWKDACDTLSGYYDNNIVVQEDITQIQNPLSFWQEHSKRMDAPDIVFGGPPCQAFSQAGKQKALDDPRGTLIYEYIRFIEALKPSFFLMENVSNLKSVSKGSLCKDILKQMDDAGYNVSCGVLCAANYGAPQKRHRMIFIGCKKELGIVPLPIMTHSDELTIFDTRPIVTVGEAFSGLPNLLNEELQ